MTNFAHRGWAARGVWRVLIFEVEATNYCDGNGLEEKSLWFWGRKSGALGKFCLTCAVEFPILYPSDLLIIMLNTAFVVDFVLTNYIILI